MTNAQRYDLEERTAKFAENVIDLTTKLLNNPTNRVLISQIIRSACSIGANYMEADVAESTRDFLHKISISRKEAKETHRWLRLIGHANKDVLAHCETLSKESWELVLIFSTIIKNTKRNQQQKK